ncbi:MAG: phosphoadenosine phosphosulfate reductase [Pseudomonadota bacterium]
MSELVTLSEELTDAEWLAEIADIGAERGYFEPIGDDHSALFVDTALDVLLVSFDTIGSARAGSASGIPHGMLQAEVNGWSHLSILTKTASWFRDENLYAYFDRLIDEAFFEDFDKVIFYGAGMCGYAAAAFSVAAAGATVILAGPVATLDPEIAGWDDRYSGARSKDFRTRYGYAPAMVDAAERVVLFYDPTEELDAMHAALFQGEQVTKVRFRHAGPRIGSELQAMNVLARVFKDAADGALSEKEIYRALRRRREYTPYLRHLLNRVHIEDRDFLTAILCRAVLTRREAPRFRHHLDTAEKKLSAAGKTLPPMRRAKRAADKLPELGP